MNLRIKKFIKNSSCTIYYTKLHFSMKDFEYNNS